MGGLRGLLDPGNWLGMKPALDPAVSPLSLDFKPSAGEVKLRIYLGLFVITLVAIVIYVLNEYVSDSGFEIFVACGFGFFGLVNLVYGYIQSRFEKSMLITDTQVFVQTRSLLGRKRWDEFVANYRGVRMREQQVERSSVGNMRSMKGYYVIELVHDDVAKTLPLYVKEEASPPRDIQEAFARRFGLPALAPDSGDEVARPVEALDQPIARQAPAADPGPPPSGVTVTQAGDLVRITARAGRVRKFLVLLFWLALPFAVGGGVYQLDPTMGLLAGGMTAFFCLMILGIGALMSRKDSEREEALCLDRERIWIDRPEYKLPRPAVWFFSLLGVADQLKVPVDPARAGLPRDGVEQIRIENYLATRRSSEGSSTTVRLDRLVIEGDQGQFHSAGSQFNRGKLEWVRNYLTCRLAGSAG